MAEGTQGKNFKDGNAYKCMQAAIERSQKLIDSCDMILDALETHPELDAPLCRAFAIMPTPPVK